MNCTHCTIPAYTYALQLTQWDTYVVNTSQEKRHKEKKKHIRREYTCKTKEEGDMEREGRERKVLYRIKWEVRKGNEE